MPQYKKRADGAPDDKEPEHYKYARKFLNQYSFLNGHEIEILFEIAKVIGDNLAPGKLPYGTYSKVAESLGMKYLKTTIIAGRETKKEYNYSAYISQIKQRIAKKVVHAYFTIYLLHTLGLMPLLLDDVQKELNNNKKAFQKAYINTLDSAYDLDSKKVDQFLVAIMTQNIDAICELTEKPPESEFIKRTKENLQRKHEQQDAYSQRSLP